MWGHWTHTAGQSIKTNRCYSVIKVYELFEQHLYEGGLQGGDVVPEPGPKGYRGITTMNARRNYEKVLWNFCVGSMRTRVNCDIVKNYRIMTFKAGRYPFFGEQVFVARKILSIFWIYLLTFGLFRSRLFTPFVNSLPRLWLYVLLNELVMW